MKAPGEIVFAFDDATADSVDTTTEAFRSLFSASPRSLDAILALHLVDGGRFPFDKLAMMNRGTHADSLGRLPALS
jgi:hypothetical protein